MATTFLEPGGDATFNLGLTTTGGFWGSGSALGSASLQTDFVHGNHVKSIKFATGGGYNVNAITPAGVVSDSGGKTSIYIYIVTLPSSTASIIELVQSGGTKVVTVRLTSGGILQLWNGTTAQIGTNGSALSTGNWYRISLAHTITSTVINRFELFKDGNSDISITNAAITNVTSNKYSYGNPTGNTVIDIRMSDFYVDNSSSLSDPGNIWVTAKRPFSNGTTNGFTTQIGSGGSGYGTGHSSQVNERPLSTTNGWSMIGAGSAITEEYNIENQSTGDINITGSTIVDYTGWAYASALSSETAQIIVNNVTNNIALTSTNTMFTQVAGSTSYPAGTGTDIGIVTTTALTTVSLYECGIMVAYIPSIPVIRVGSMLRMFQ